MPSPALSEALRTCAARGLPAVCANPDFTVALPDGSIGHMPGAVARAYEALGGKVAYHGKPHAAAFAAALELLGPGVPRHRIVHVGDSLAHDVAGANAAGIHSLFVGAGIHAPELHIPDGAAGAAAAREEEEGGGGAKLTVDALERLFAAHGIRPTMSVEAFRWKP